MSPACFQQKTAASKPQKKTVRVPLSRAVFGENHLFRQREQPVVPGRIKASC